MFKIEKIRKGINISFGIVIILLLLFSGIQFPNIYLAPNQSSGVNIPIIIAFIVVFSVFICFNITFKIKKEQLTELEVIEREEKNTNE